LVEPSEQTKPNKITKILVDDTLTSSIEQPDIQRINVLDAPVNQPQHSLEQTDLQTRQPAEVQSPLVVSLLLSSSNSSSLFQDIVNSSTEVHDKSLGDLQQDTGDQPQLPIVEVSESSSVGNPSAQIRATSSVVEANFLVSSNLFSSSFAFPAGFNKLAFYSGHIGSHSPR
jgi:hypothetical protein